jgi:hypothetical protein
LPDRSFDVVVSFETIEHLQNPTLYLKEIHRTQAWRIISVLHSGSAPGVDDVPYPQTTQ